LLAGTEGATIRLRAPQSDEPDILDRRLFVAVCGGGSRSIAAGKLAATRFARESRESQRQYF
jgi:hypothetical protein